MSIVDKSGPKADVKIWNETKLPEELDENPKLGDKVYLGGQANPNFQEKAEMRRIKRGAKSGKQTNFARANLC